MSVFDQNYILEYFACFAGSGKAICLLESMQHHTSKSTDKVGDVNGEIIIEDLLCFSRIFEIVFQAYITGDRVQIVMSHITQLTAMSSVLVRNLKYCNLKNITEFQFLDLFLAELWGPFQLVHQTRKCLSSCFWPRTTRQEHRHQGGSSGGQLPRPFGMHNNIFEFVAFFPL